MKEIIQLAAGQAYSELEKTVSLRRPDNLSDLELYMNCKFAGNSCEVSNSEARSIIMSLISSIDATDSAVDNAAKWIRAIRDIEG